MNDEIPDKENHSEGNVEGNKDHEGIIADQDMDSESGTSEEDTPESSNEIDQEPEVIPQVVIPGPDETQEETDTEPVPDEEENQVKKTPESSEPQPMSKLPVGKLIPTSDEKTCTISSPVW